MSRFFILLLFEVCYYKADRKQLYLEDLFVGLQVDIIGLSFFVRGQRLERKKVNTNSLLDVMRGKNFEEVFVYFF